MKLNLKNYYHPTPKKYRKIGDALLGTAQFATGLAIVNDSKELAILFMIIGCVGKFLSNLFTEDNAKNTQG
jgi:hypothetical protein